MVGRHGAGAHRLYPRLSRIADAVNPALIAAQERTPVVVETDPATCSVQFDPVGTARFDTACDIAKSQLASTGIGYRRRGLGGQQDPHPGRRHRA